MSSISLRKGATLPNGWSIEVSRIAEAYGQSGGALQAVVRDGSGAFVNVNGLDGIFNVTARAVS